MMLGRVGLWLVVGFHRAGSGLDCRRLFRFLAPSIIPYAVLIQINPSIRQPRIVFHFERSHSP
jgi:hypothetical protein